MTSQQKRLPAWASIIVALVVIAIVSAMGGSFAFLMAIKDIAELQKNPEKIAKIANTVFAFPSPLPTGYKYFSAVDSAFVAIIDIDHEPDNQHVMLWATKFGPDQQDPRRLLSLAYDIGINTIETNAKFHKIKSRGNEQFGNVDMPYIIGEYTDQRGKTSDGLVACLSVNNAAKNILIYAYPSPGNAYNHGEVMDLLKSIKAF